MIIRERSVYERNDKTGNKCNERQGRKITFYVKDNFNHLLEMFFITGNILSCFFF